MAGAPGHRLGQIIGDTLEVSLDPVLREFAEEHGLYLDVHGPRPARSGMKVAWIDDLGNSHDLDFVLERGGTPTRIGNPAAFIESAWRRYTKHSRNKAQEIQGAVLPLLSKYAEVNPFAGAIVAGVWTDGALTQLRSSGFSVLHIEYDEIIAAFSQFGIDVGYDESTDDDRLQAQVDAYDRLSEADKHALGDALRQCAPHEYERFMEDLKASVLRTVDRILVIPLHGEKREFSSLDDAVDDLLNYDTHSSHAVEFVRFEIHIRFSNGDHIEASFQDASDAVSFLRSFR